MVKTEMINSTKSEVELKEGNAGVYRLIKRLPDTGRYVLEIDPNATYREYVVIVQPTGEKIFVTSDDCIDNSTIELIFDKKDSVYTFTGIPRGDSEEPKSRGFLSRLFNRMFKGDSSL